MSKEDSLSERRNNIVGNTQLLAAVFDSQKVDKQWEGQLLLNKNVIAQKIQSATGFNIQADLEATTQALENEHFYHRTANSPRRQGAVPGINADITAVLVGIAYEVGNMEDIVVVQDYAYKQLARHFPGSINARLMHSERIRQLQNIFALGINLRQVTETERLLQEQDRLEKRSAILASHPYAAAFLSDEFDPTVISDSHEHWTEMFAFLYRQKREEIDKGRSENWLFEKLGGLAEGLETSFPSRELFEINGPFLAAILVTIAWDLGEENLTFLKNEIVDRARAYIFDALRLGHPYLSDSERQKFEQIFAFGLRIRNDQQLPDIGDVPGLDDL